MSWIDAMTVDGLSVLITPDGPVALADRSSGWRWGPAPLTRRMRSLRSGDLENIVRRDGAGLLVARRASQPALTSLTTAGTAWALDDGRYRVDDHHSDRITAVPDDRRRSDTLGALALVLADQRHTHSQRSIARALDVSQPLVHRLLQRLQRSDVEHSPTTELVDLWWQRGHHPPSERQHWVADLPAWEQVSLAYARLDEHGHEPVVGGEPAADATTAWTAPTTAILHARGLRPLGPPFIAAVDRHEATLTVEATRDPLTHTLAARTSTPVGTLRVAHPAIVIRDLEPLAATDDRVTEQLAALRDHLMRDVLDHATH